MGVIYYIGCKDCKTSRDLDKFYTLHFGKEVDTREKALKYAEEDVSKDSFRCGLLLSFLSQHYGHSIVMFDDCGAENEFEQMPEGYNFWA